MWMARAALHSAQNTHQGNDGKATAPATAFSTMDQEMGGRSGTPSQTVSGCSVSDRQSIWQAPSWGTTEGAMPNIIGDTSTMQTQQLQSHDLSSGMLELQQSCVDELVWMTWRGVVESAQQEWSFFWPQR